MRISARIEQRRVSALRPYRFSRFRLAPATKEDDDRLIQSLTTFPPDKVQVAIQGLPDGRVVIGQRRVAVARAAGIESLPYQVIEEAEPEEIEQWAACHNLGGRVLTPGVLAVLTSVLTPRAGNPAVQEVPDPWVSRKPLQPIRLPAPRPGQGTHLEEWGVSPTPRGPGPGRVASRSDPVNPCPTRAVPSWNAVRGRGKLNHDNAFRTGE